MPARFVEPVTLRGDLATLEPLAATHAAGLASAAADGDLHTLWYTSVAAPERMEQYVAAALDMRERLGAMPFVIRDNASGGVVGSTRYFNVDPVHRRLEIGHTWHARSAARTGINTESKLMLLTHAFETLGCIAVELRTHWFNQASRAAIARLGAKQDGVLRNHQLLADGSRRDTVVFSIIDGEWAAVKRHLRFLLDKPRTASGAGMLTGFLLHLKAHKLPVSTREFLVLLEALEKRVVALSLDDFHALARICLIKNEQHFDRFDVAFGSYFKDVDALFHVRADIPDAWLRREFERTLSEDDRRAVAALGGYDRLMETLKQRLAEQRARHAGGSKWIGTGGTSPFGAYGYNPEGVRMGQEAGRSRSAVKVWDERAFRNLDGSVELNTRNLKVALRKLRRFAREGVPDELDLDATIEGTARNAGWLDLQMQPERRNRVKVLLFLDVGGSMDPHVTVCEELFSAARSEFRHLETFYFHNCIYDHVWRDNARRTERVSTLELLRTYGPDWRMVVVGDAAMSPYELAEAGGSVEYSNDETGLAWLTRLFDHFGHRIWWNPEPARTWEYTRSTQMIAGVLGPKMFPLTLDGVAAGIDALRK